jgi:D-alanine transaminase
VLVYLNGEYLPAERALVPAGDRGFLFGDGVYEVTRAIDGRLFAADRHMLRLARGLRVLAIDVAPAEQEALLEVSERLLAENGLAEREAAVYVQITRGAALRTHHFPPAGTRPTVYAFAWRLTPIPELRAEGARVVTHPDLRWARCDLKTVNLLPNVLAKQKAHEAGAFEAVLVRDGAITEGSHTSIFGVVDGELRTYPLTHHILPSITREIVLELAAEAGIEVRQQPIRVEELAHLSEMFLTSTTADVLPIVSVDGRPVGTGRPGPVAERLYTRLAELMRVGARQPAGV